jgi:hypothetical protein
MTGAHWKAVIGVILIFIFGFCAGAVCTSLLAQRKALVFLQHPAVVMSAALETRLTGNLNLDATQKQQVHDYFMQNLEHRRELQTQIQPQVQLANLETFQQIYTILRPDQQQRFHQNLSEYRKRLGKNILNQNARPQNQVEPGARPNGPATNSDVGTPPTK